MAKLPKNLALLRLIVIIMGVALLFGTIAFFIAVYMKFYNHKANVTPNSPVQVTGTQDKCIFQPLGNIEVNGNIMHSSVNGNILTIVTDEAEKQRGAQGSGQYQQKQIEHIILFDLCRGIVLSRLNVVHSEVRP